MKNAPAQTSVVCISGELVQRHPRLAHQLLISIQAHEIELWELEGTADIWARDFSPIQRDDGAFVSFTFNPNYLRNGFRHLITDWRKTATLPKNMTVVDADLVLDGGNVVLEGQSAVATNKVFKENPHLSHQEVENRLRDAFHLDKLILIPQETGDIWGHADGMVAWAGPDHLVMNDYRQIDLKLHRELKGIFARAGVEVTEIPYAPDLREREIPSAEGTYTNLIILPEIVLLPVYGIHADERALKAMMSVLPDRSVLTIDASTLAPEGGSLHCITWNWRQLSDTRKSGRNSQDKIEQQKKPDG